MKVNQSSWKFAVATTGGLFLIATGIHVLSRPTELVNYVANGVQEILPDQGILPDQTEDPSAVSSAE